MCDGPCVSGHMVLFYRANVKQNTAQTQNLGSEAGATHTAGLFSIIRTAIINGLDPYRYLEYALGNVGKKPIEAILPYSKDLEIR